MPEKTAQLSIRTTAVRKANLKRLARKEGRSVDDMLAYHFKLDHINNKQKENNDYIKK